MTSECVCLDIWDYRIVGLFMGEKMRWIKDAAYATVLYSDESALLNILQKNTNKFKGQQQTRLTEIVVSVGWGDTVKDSVKNTGGGFVYFKDC